MSPDKKMSDERAAKIHFSQKTVHYALPEDEYFHHVATLKRDFENFTNFVVYRRQKHPAEEMRKDSS